MNTQAHVIFNLALLGRKQRSDWNPLIVLGALIPDIAMFGFYAYMRLGTDIPEMQIWQVEYFKPSWQLLFAPFNSIPLALLGLGITLYKKRTGLALMFGSVLLHCLGDLPLHHDDAHRHFWPVSDFRFISPVSYWHPDHYGGIVGPIEIVLMAVASIYVFRRVRSRWAKGLLIVANALPAVLYLWWSAAMA